MPTTDDLHEAGARYARNPVTAPPVEALVAQASRRRNRRRAIIGSSLAGVALVAAVPFAAALRNDDPPPSVLTSAQEGEPAAEDGGPGPETDDSTPSDPAEPGDSGEVDGADDVGSTDDGKGLFEGLFGSDDDHFELQLGDSSFTVNAIGGDRATDSASDAEAAADETRDIDGTEVWIRRDGDRTTVAALVEPRFYVEVSGPTEALDELLTMLSTSNGMFHFEPFEPGSLEGLPPEVRELLEKELEELEDLRRRLEEEGLFTLPESGDLSALDELLPSDLRDQLENGRPFFGEGEFEHFFGDGALENFFDDMFSDSGIEDTIDA